MDYRAFSLRIESDWPLALPQALADDPAPRLRFFHDPGLKLDFELPFRLGRIAYGRRGESIGVRIPWLGDFLIRGRSEVALRPGPEAREQSIGLYFTGLVLPFRLHLEAFLFFHASAAAFPDGAALFLGNQGAGKSTTAAALARRGFPILCDDVAPIGPGPTLHPGIGRPKLLPDAYERLLGGTGGALWDGVDKYHAELPSSEQTLPLKAIFLLLPRGGQSGVEARRIRGREKFKRILEHIQTIEGLDQAGAQFDRLSAWLASTPLYAISRPAEGDSLDEVLALVEECLGKGGT